MECLVSADDSSKRDPRLNCFHAHRSEVITPLDWILHFHQFSLFWLALSKALKYLRCWRSTNCWSTKSAKHHFATCKTIEQKKTLVNQGLFKVKLEKEFNHKKIDFIHVLSLHTFINQVNLEIVTIKLRQNSIIHDATLIPRSMLEPGLCLVAKKKKLSVVCSEKTYIILDRPAKASIIKTIYVILEKYF